MGVGEEELKAMVGERWLPASSRVPPPPQGGLKEGSAQKGESHVGLVPSFLFKSHLDSTGFFPEMT